MPDFKVQRFDLDITVSTTGVETGFKTFDFTSFDPVGSITKTIIFPCGTTPGIHGGPSAGSSSNQNPINGTFWLDFLTTSSIRIRIPSGASNVQRRYSFQLVEYIGSAGGPNEFVKVDEFRIDLSSSQTENFSSSAVANFTQRNRCAIVSKGLIAIANSYQGALVCLRWDDDDFILANRGITGSTTCSVFLSIFEFTGSNWTIGHYYTSGSPTPGTFDVDIVAEISYQASPQTILDIDDWSNAFILSTFSATTTTQDRLVNYGHILKNSSNTSKITRITDSLATTSGAIIAAHILSNPDITVRHSDPADPGVSDSNFNVTISPAIADLDQASVHAAMINPSFGVETIGFVRLVDITDTTTVNWRTHRVSGETLTLYQAVVEWQFIAGPATHNVDLIQNLFIASETDGGYGYYMNFIDSLREFDAMSCFTGFARSLGITNKIFSEQSAKTDFAPIFTVAGIDGSIAAVAANLGGSFIAIGSSDLRDVGSWSTNTDFAQILTQFISGLAGFRVETDLTMNSMQTQSGSSVAFLEAQQMFQLSEILEQQRFAGMFPDLAHGWKQLVDSSVSGDFEISVREFSFGSLEPSVVSGLLAGTGMNTIHSGAQQASSDSFPSFTIMEISTNNQALNTTLFGIVSCMSIADESESVFSEFHPGSGLFERFAELADGSIPRFAALQIAHVLQKVSEGGKIAGVLLRPDTRVIHVFGKAGTLK